jgi:hypothetical protein
MRAEAARAGKRLKHAVAALSVVGTVAGQSDLYRRLASMADVKLLDALAADNIELILEGSRFPPGTNGPRPTSQTRLNTGQGSREVRRKSARMLKQGPSPQRPSTSLGPPASTRPAPNRTKRAHLTSNSKRDHLTCNRGRPDRTERTEDIRTETAKHSRAAPARNSRSDTSHQQARLKRSCQWPSKELRPICC